MLKQLNNKIEQLIEEYKVYDPESGEGSKFDSRGIRNIMISYFLADDVQGIYDKILQQINKMPDEWVVQFLNNQEDTKVR